MSWGAGRKLAGYNLEFTTVFWLKNCSKLSRLLQLYFHSTLAANCQVFYQHAGTIWSATCPSLTVTVSYFIHIWHLVCLFFSFVWLLICFLLKTCKMLKTLVYCVGVMQILILVHVYLVMSPCVRLVNCKRKKKKKRKKTRKGEKRKSIPLQNRLSSWYLKNQFLYLREPNKSIIISLIWNRICNNSVCKPK